MRGLVWFVAWFCVGLWSVIAVVGYWLIDVLTGIAANNADKIGSDPETAEFINWLALLLQGIGSVTAVILWAVITIAILGIAWFITRLIGRPSGTQPPAPT